MRSGLVGYRNLTFSKFTFALKLSGFRPSSDSESITGFYKSKLIFISTPAYSKPLNTYSKATEHLVHQVEPRLSKQIANSVRLVGNRCALKKTMKTTKEYDWILLPQRLLDLPPVIVCYSALIGLSG